MSNLIAYSIFARAYELGNFSAVGREMGLTQSSISKHIAALEADLGVQLFARTTRKLRPTHDAATLYEGVQHLLDVMDSIHSSLDKSRRELSGLLRIALPDTYGRIVVLPRLARFIERYPKIHLDVRLVRLSEQVVNLVSEGVELGIQIGELNSSTMVARSLGSSEHKVVASPEYLARHGEPRYPTDLLHHNCIVYTGLAYGGRWVFESEHGGRQVIDVRGNFTVNSIDGAYRLVRDGLGIARIPVWVLGDDMQQGKARVLLAEDYLVPMPINIVFLKTRVLSKRARHLIDFLLAELGG
jgi:DNA-binding transcriptional LysR family regulator